jgi:hypothetical protein
MRNGAGMTKRLVEILRQGACVRAIAENTWNWIRIICSRSNCKSLPNGHFGGVRDDDNFDTVIQGNGIIVVVMHQT